MSLKKFLRWIREAWIILGIALAILIAIEMAISLGFYLRSFWHHPAANFRVNADTYSDRSSAIKYYKELDQFEREETIRWEPYVYWRRTPRQGEFINISPDGLRKTINLPASGAEKPPIKVFMFGGSTIWGLGSGDDLTIPSIFSEKAKMKGIDCEVVNFGQYAYVSTQGVIQLMLQLQKGNIPDAVIFFDGVNDTFGAFQLKVPGLPFDEFRREQEFNLLESKGIMLLAIQSEIRWLSTVRFLNGMLKKFDLQKDNFQTIPLEYQQPIPDKKDLARAVVDIYANNIKMVRALSEFYGFTCLFYWQPVIYLKQHLTDYERNSIERDFNYPGMKDFYLMTYQEMASSDLKNYSGFHNISEIFREITEPIFVDFNHMGEKGNRIIANRMVEDFSHLVKTNQKLPKHIE
jgi:lysophospholipase L1-like esterase